MNLMLPIALFPIGTLLLLAAVFADRHQMMFFAAAAVDFCACAVLLRKRGV